MQKFLRKYAALIVINVVGVAFITALVVSSTIESGERREGYNLYTNVLPKQLEAGVQDRNQLLDTYYASCQGATVGFDFELRAGCGVTSEDVQSYNRKAKTYNDTLARTKDLLYDPLTGQHHQGIAQSAPLDIATLVR